MRGKPIEELFAWAVMRIGSRRFFVSMILALLIYYGAALLPLAYLLGTGFRGPHRGPMLSALGWHIALSLAVVALVWWSLARGDSEWYWAWAFNVPVNVVLAIAYIAILVDRRV